MIGWSLYFFHADRDDGVQLSTVVTPFEQLLCSGFFALACMVYITDDYVGFLRFAMSLFWRLEKEARR